MSDFADPKAQLSTFASKLKATAQAQPTATQPTEATPVTPVVPTAPEPTAAAITTEPSPAPVAPATVPVDVAPAKAPASTDPKPVDEPVVPWDQDFLQPASKPDAPLTIESISSALKLDGVKSIDDVVGQFTQREAKIKELETAREQQFSNIPTELKDVIGIAQKGGDWKAHLGARLIDYSKADPSGLFEQELANAPRFRNQDGSFDQAAFDLELEQVPLSTREVLGNQIKHRLVQEQEKIGRAHV